MDNRKIVDYKVIRKNDIEDIEIIVKELLLQNYELYGPVVFCVSPSGIHHYVREMILYKEETVENSHRL